MDGDHRTPTSRFGRARIPVGQGLGPVTACAHPQLRMSGSGLRSSSMLDSVTRSVVTTATVARRAQLPGYPSGLLLDEPPIQRGPFVAGGPGYLSQLPPWSPQTSPVFLHCPQFSLPARGL